MRPIAETLSLAWTNGSPASVRDRAIRVAPGLMLAVVIAAAARFAGEHADGPPTVYALALGVSLGALASETRCRPGLAFASRQLVRAGIVLLGLTFGIREIAALGSGVIAATVGCVAVSLAIGWRIGRLFGLKAEIAVLSACASAICGATAAMAVSCILPATPETDRMRGLVVGVVALASTVAMVALPALLPAIGFDQRQSGFVIGAMIADMAQVIGAGYALGDEAGLAATLVKLVRVSCLAPVVVLVGLMLRVAPGAAGAARPPLVPGFIIAFGALAALTSTGVVPDVAKAWATETSRWCLLAAIAALGVQMTLRGVVADGGGRVLAALGAQALFLTGLACGAALLLL